MDESNTKSIFMGIFFLFVLAVIVTYLKNTMM